MNDQAGTISLSPLYKNPSRICVFFGREVLWTLGKVWTIEEGLWGPLLVNWDRSRGVVMVSLLQAVVGSLLGNK